MKRRIEDRWMIRHGRAAQSPRLRGLSSAIGTDRAMSSASAFCGTNPAFGQRADYVADLAPRAMGPPE